MEKFTTPRDDREWLDYYDRFDYFSIATVRNGCDPCIMEHQQPTDKAIVLVRSLALGNNQRRMHFKC